MSIKITCPECSAQYPIAAGLLDDDGKRLAAITGEMEPAMARAALAYLKFFKPHKTALRASRAVSILQELHELVKAGSVCKDERGGLRRPATYKAWVAGIEHMHQVDGRLSLPLSNHNYLRSIVFAIADKDDVKAEAERAKQPTAIRSETANDASEHVIWLGDQLRRGAITKEQHDEQLAEHRARRQSIVGAAKPLMGAK